MNAVLLDLLTRLFDGVPGWQATILLVGISLTIAVALEVVVLRTLLRYTSRTKTQYDHILVEELRLPIVVTAALTGVYLLTQVPSITETVLVTGDQLEIFFGKPSLSVIIIAWALASNRIVNRFVEEVKDKGSRYDFAPVFSNVWTLIVFAGTIATLLSLWEYSISPLLGAAGVAGIAVGFAARDTVANFFGGIALYFDDTYKLGDYIELDSGEAGTVVEVGIRSTTLMTRDEVLVTVPNSVLNAAKVINQSAPQRRKRLAVPIGVGYGTDIDAFEELVLEIAADESLVLDSPKPRMRFRAFGNSALQYELLCWVAAPTRAARATHELNRAMYKTLTGAEIDIPFPQREIHISSGEVTTEWTDTTAEEADVTTEWTDTTAEEAESTQPIRGDGNEPPSDPRA
ncbi:mechanosensitive ion channel family protein [Natrinema halophilum]|uniref:Mechanosensitive ion channel family protein n=1 Tax=Natrinema halophilum TaxID=1699371 RepID=A0A7D5KYE3_9EURY|nr:mechanosensitive ion channel family protein [Natrinema halophilum]QLG50582.1 mechanosensitive ion channel family protein [Natrinema halophilum]